MTDGVNPFNVPSDGYGFTAGSPTTITWTPTTSGTVTLQLRSGSSNNLSEGTTIASSVPNSGSFTYTPPDDVIPASDYLIEIIDDSDPSTVNYTPQFAIKAASSSASDSFAGASSTLLSTASSASRDSSSASSTVAAASTTATSTPSASESSNLSLASASETGFFTTAYPSSVAQPTTTPTAISNSPTGLSTGAKAGIGIGAALAVLILVALGYYIGRRARRQNAGADTDMGDLPEKVETMGSRASELGPKNPHQQAFDSQVLGGEFESQAVRTDRR